MRFGHKIHTQNPYIEVTVPLSHFMNVEATNVSLSLRCSGATTVEARTIMRRKIDTLIQELNAMLEEL